MRVRRTRSHTHSVHSGNYTVNALQWIMPHVSYSWGTLNRRRIYPLLPEIYCFIIIHQSIRICACGKIGQTDICSQKLSGTMNSIDLEFGKLATGWRSLLPYQFGIIFFHDFEAVENGWYRWTKTRIGIPLVIFMACQPAMLQSCRRLSSTAENVSTYEQNWCTCFN